MPEVKLSIGGKLDIVSPQELKESISGLQGHLDRKLMSNFCQPVRRIVRASGNFVVPFGGDAQVTLIGNDNHTKGPAVGKVWVVRSMFVFDNVSPLTITQSGLIGALCIGDAASPVPVDMSGWNFTALPASNTFNSTSLVVEPNQSLYVVINTALSNAAIGFNAFVDEWDANAFQAVKI